MAAFNRHDALSTMRAVVRATRADRGRLAALWVAMMEWLDFVKAIARTRLGWQTPISTGASAPPPRRRRVLTSALDRYARDTRHAFRSLMQTRAYTGVAVGTLALGIGVNAAVFTILDSILWRPVPFREPARLVELSNKDSVRGMTYGGFSVRLLEQWRDQTDLFDAVEAYDRASFVYRSNAGSQMVSGAIVTPGLFSALGVTPVMGRGFGSGDGRTGTDHIVLVSEAFWRSHLGARRDVLGQVLDLNGAAFQIVGVVPSSFRYPEARDLWTPFDPSSPPAGGVVPRMLSPVARLRSGVTFDQAAPTIRSRGGALSEAAGGQNTITAIAGHMDRSPGNATRQTLWLLGAAVSALLMIICANVASLTLSRSLDRVRDGAVRVALGAKRADLVRARLIEHGLVGLAATAGAVLVANGALRAALAVMPDAMTTTALNAIEVDARMLGLTLAVGVVTLVVFGLPSAILGSRSAVITALRSDARTMAGGPAANRWRGGLLVAEVTLAVALLIAGAALTRSVLRLNALDRGFDVSNLMTMTVGLPGAGYQDKASRDRVSLEALARVRHLPGITGATLGGLPVDLSGVNVGQVEVADLPGQRTPQMVVPIFEVPTDYFSTLGLAIVRGRPFRDDDESGTVVISERLASRLKPGGDPAGLRFHFGDGPWLTVVGVAADVRPLFERDAMQAAAIYYPFGRETGAFRPVAATSIVADYRTLVIRAAQPGAAVPAVTAAIHDLDPSIVIWKTTMADHVFADSIARPRAVFLMMAVFAISGLVTASAGLYGVLAYLVAQRRREIGIRLALGARPADVGRVVFRRGLALAAAGAGLGIGVALALGRAWRALLFEVEPTDTVSIIVVIAIVGLATVLASWWPARRAMRIDPVELLRSE